MKLHPARRDLISSLPNSIQFVQRCSRCEIIDNELRSVTGASCGSWACKLLRGKAWFRCIRAPSAGWGFWHSAPIFHQFSMHRKFVIYALTEANSFRFTLIHTSVLACGNSCFAVRNPVGQLRNWRLRSVTGPAGTLLVVRRDERPRPVSTCACRRHDNDARLLTSTSTASMGTREGGRGAGVDCLPCVPLLCRRWLPLSFDFLTHPLGIYRVYNFNRYRESLNIVTQTVSLI